jgi:protein disulfide-isomerase
VEAALLAARRSSRLVLLNFGANWCSDCRAFARAMADPALSGLIDDDFVTVKIDVGNWDRNPDVVDEWGNPIAEGIPALVIVSPAREVLFSTRRGQVSNASRMSREELAAFFHLLAEAAQASRNTAAPER